MRALATPSPPGGGIGTSWTAIAKLVWPLALTMVFNAAVSLIDAWVAGRYDAASQAAVGLTSQIILLIGSATTASSIGSQALIARFVGAGAWGDAGQAAKQTVILGGTVSLALVVPMFLFAPGLFHLMGADASVQAAGTRYLRLVIFALPAMDVSILLNSIFRARGQTVAVLISNGVENGLWALGSWGLGFQLGWGLQGLAYGFLLGKLAGLVTTWGLYRRSEVYAHMPASWRPSTRWFRRILAIGVPAGIQVVARNAGMLAYFTILELLPSPTQAVAAFTIGMRIESLAFLPVFALNIATATLVGQSLGAGRPDEARAAAWRVAWLGIFVMVVCALLFVFAADTLVSGFSSDAGVRHLAARYLQLVAVSEPFLALVMVFNGATQGAGDTRPAMVFTFVSQLCFRLPLSYFLAVTLKWGTDGAWWGMTVSMFLQALFVVTYFVRGPWQTRKV